MNKNKYEIVELWDIFYDSRRKLIGWLVSCGKSESEIAESLSIDALEVFKIITLTCECNP